MRKIKNILSKALLLSLTLAMCVSMTIGAADAQWNNIFTENFDSLEAIPESYTIPTASPTYSAEIAEGALKTTSNDHAYLEYTGVSSKKMTFTEDSNYIGMINNTGNQLATGGKSVVVGGYTFKEDSPVGNNSVYLDELDGRMGAKIGNFANTASKVLRGNYLAFYVDENKALFGETDNNIKIEVDYFMTSTDPTYGITRNFYLDYIDTNGKTQTAKLSDAKTDAEMGENEWKTWTIELEDIDLTRTSSKDSQKYNLHFRAPIVSNVTIAAVNGEPNYFVNKGVDPGFAVYVASVRVMRANAPETYEFDNNAKTIQVPLSSKGFGDSKFTFDMTLPSDEEYYKNTNYNAEGGALRVSLANDNKDELATLQIENDGNEQTIYAISTDGSGNEVKSSAIYTGDILGKTLTYTIEMSFRDENYTVSIADGSDPLVSETTAFGINNIEKTNGSAQGSYLVVTHAKVSPPVMAVIDNLSLDSKDDDIYLKLKEDIDEIVLDTEVEFEFVLPAVGSVNSSNIAWESSDPAVLSITDIDGVVTATPHCDEEPKQIKLIATATKTGDALTCVKEFDITVVEHADHKKLIVEKEALEILSLDASMRAEEDFPVPTQGSDSTVFISWASDNIDYTSGAAIIVSNGVADVFRGEFDSVVTLTATITVGSFTETKAFPITIPGLDGVKATIGPISQNPSTVDGIDYYSPTVRVEAPGIYGELTFAAYALDANGRIIDSKDHKQDVTEYATYDFVITNLKVTGSTEVKYYFWDANGVSIVNNEPTQIKDLKVEGKAKGIKLNWSASQDDFDAVAYYAIYRDGTLIATTPKEETSYLDSAVGTEQHSYSVVPYDKNALYPAKSNEGAAATIEMYYIDFENKTSLGVGEHSPGGSYLVWGTTSFDGINVATAAKSKAIGLTVSTIPATENDITFEVTYLDNATKIRLDYMMNNGDGTSSRTSTPIEGSGGNTGEWKTAEVHVPNIHFIKSTVVSGSDFNITGDDTVIIKKVSLIQTEKFR